MLFDTVETYSNELGTSTRFRNILKLHDKWKDE